MKTEGSPERWTSRLACQRCMLHDKLALCEGQFWGNSEEGQPEYLYVCIVCGWSEKKDVYYR